MTHSQTTSPRDGKRTRTPLSRLPESGPSNMPNLDRKMMSVSIDRSVVLIRIEFLLRLSSIACVSACIAAFKSMGGVGLAFSFYLKYTSIFFATSTTLTVLLLHTPHSTMLSRCNVICQCNTRPLRSYCINVLGHSQRACCKLQEHPTI